jgi:hypothetical protein
MEYVLFGPNWLGRTMTTALGLKSALKKPRTCAVDNVLRVNVTSNATSPTRASAARYAGSEQIYAAQPIGVRREV